MVRFHEENFLCNTIIVSHTIHKRSYINTQTTFINSSKKIRVAILRKFLTICRDNLLLFSPYLSTPEDEVLNCWK